MSGKSYGHHVGFATSSSYLPSGGRGYNEEDNRREDNSGNEEHQSNGLNQFTLPRRIYDRQVVG